ncbi:MAG: hypothetical protein KBS62_07595 [Oscillospiraceae bacterium]|nr:hypothetical protein [Candidatus Ruminococcus equi]
MIRGINHQVIEITSIDNKYYERALLVLRPEYSSVHRDLLEHEARKMLKDFNTLSAFQGKRKFRYLFFKLLFSTIFGAAVTTLIFLLIK